MAWEAREGTSPSPAVGRIGWVTLQPVGPGRAGGAGGERETERGAHWGTATTYGRTTAGYMRVGLVNSYSLPVKCNVQPVGKNALQLSAGSTSRHGQLAGTRAGAIADHGPTTAPAMIHWVVVVSALLVRAGWFPLVRGKERERDANQGTLNDFASLHNVTRLTRTNKDRRRCCYWQSYETIPHDERHGYE